MRSLERQLIAQEVLPPASFEFYGSDHMQKFCNKVELSQP